MVCGIIASFRPVLLPYRDHRCHNEDMCTHFSVLIFCGVNIRFHFLLCITHRLSLSAIESEPNPPQMCTLKTCACVHEQTSGRSLSRAKFTSAMGAKSEEIRLLNLRLKSKTCRKSKQFMMTSKPWPCQVPLFPCPCPLNIQIYAVSDLYHMDAQYYNWVNIRQTEKRYLNICQFGIMYISFYWNHANLCRSSVGELCWQQSCDTLKTHLPDGSGGGLQTGSTLINLIKGKCCLYF